MRIKYFVLCMMALLAIISSVAFTVINYKTHSTALLDGLDDKLFTAAHSARALLGKDFHDKIVDKSSLSKEKYLEIVDTYNKLCLELDLEYIWSLILIDDKIVFTTGTSTSKDVTKGDHALFFDPHTSPEQYFDTFKDMQPHFQITDDKWGRIKVALVPFKDKLGRPYLFGASIKVDHVDALLKNTLAESCIAGAIIISLGILFSVIVVSQLSKPIEEVTEIAGQIATGNLNQKATPHGCRETRSLSTSINAMSTAIESQITQLQAGEQQLRASNQQLIASEQQLKATNQQLMASEQQLRATNQQLSAKDSENEKILKALAIKNKELESIVYISSHDLRSPLVNIQGFSGELNRSCQEIMALAQNPDDPQSIRQMQHILNDDIPESLNFITSSTAKMKSLLDGLLRMSRVGSTEVKITSVDMNELLNEVKAAIGFQIQENQTELIINDLPHCTGDTQLLNQVFTNLIDNAIKYRDIEKQTLIEISGWENNTHVTYTIEDNGIGIEEEYQKKIFEIFHRLNPNDNIEGEGLGLSIVSRIVDRLDGSISIQSQPQKGTTFHISMPKA